jgi:hypothetical protein
VREQHGPQPLGVERRGEREAGVVGGRVPVRRAAEQGVGADGRLAGEHARAAERAVRAHVPPQGERVVEREARGELPPRHARAAVHRPREGERAHEVRRGA